MELKFGRVSGRHLIIVDVGVGVVSNGRLP